MTMAEGDLAVTEIAFVRKGNIAPRPPLVAMTGALGWLRENLLSTPFNIALTILIALLFAWAIPELVKFLLIDAVWTVREASGPPPGSANRWVQPRPSWARA